MITPYLICIIISTLVNLMGLSLFYGPPGLQYIMLPIITLLSFLLIAISMLFTKRSRYHIKISLVLFLVSILTIIPSTLQNGHDIQSAGLLYFGLMVIVEFVMIFLAYKNKHLFK